MPAIYPNIDGEKGLFSAPSDGNFLWPAGPIKRVEKIKRKRPKPKLEAFVEA
jgi:hypothetical protein